MHTRNGHTPQSGWGRLLAIVLGLTWMTTGCGADAMEVTIDPGPKARPAGPISFTPTRELDPGKTYFLTRQGLDPMPVQVDSTGTAWCWIESPMPPSRLLAALLPEDELGVPPEVPRRIHVRPADNGTITVSIDDEMFTRLNFKKDEPKVYLYPVIGPTGMPVTRDYPMKDNPIEKKNGRQDHHHHRSIWCAHGEVRSSNCDIKANYWHEPEPAKQDRQVVKRIIRTAEGPVFGLIEAEIDWVTHTGVRQFTEIRTYRFFAGRLDRMIDVTSAFKFNDADVTFDDTKEGGILSIRTAVTLDERGIKEPKEMHGLMTNINGQKTENECWGQPAAWCDYSGPLLTGDTVGIAVFDHPENFRHPTRWHIRGYGLYTANPFGWSHFMRDKNKNGSHTWKKGEQETFNYRILIHRGDTEQAKVDEHWKLYSSPPEVTAK